jgi:hypothetical protein
MAYIKKKTKLRKKAQGGQPLGSTDRNTARSQFNDYLRSSGYSQGLNDPRIQQFGYQLVQDPNTGQYYYIDAHGNRMNAAQEQEQDNQATVEQIEDTYADLQGRFGGSDASAGKVGKNRNYWDNTGGIYDTTNPSSPNFSPDINTNYSTPSDLQNMNINPGGGTEVNFANFGNTGNAPINSFGTSSTGYTPSSTTMQGLPEMGTGSMTQASGFDSASLGAGGEGLGGATSGGSNAGAGMDAAAGNVAGGASALAIITAAMNTMGALGENYIDRNFDISATGRNAGKRGGDHAYMGTDLFSFKNPNKRRQKYKQERNLWANQMDLASQVGDMEKDIRESSNVGLGATPTSKAYRSDIGNRQFVAQGGGIMGGVNTSLGALQNMPTANMQDYHARNEAIETDRKEFNANDFAAIVKPVLSMYGAGFLADAIPGQVDMQQEYGYGTGGWSSGTAEGGGTKTKAKNVEPLRNKPAGSQMQLPGGKAVSRGGGIIEYLGNSHEEGGIKTKSNSGEIIEAEDKELDVIAKDKSGKPVEYIVSDYYKDSKGESPADMIRNGGSVQNAVKFNEEMASKQGTPYGGPADPSRSPDNFARYGMKKAQGGYGSETEHMKYQGTGQYIDHGGNINRSSWRNIHTTGWGDMYGITEDTSQEELQRIYNEEYIPTIEEFYSNPTDAIPILQYFTEADNPNADNFKRTFKGLDFADENDWSEILRRAKAKSTDGSIGSFHMFRTAPATTEKTTNGETPIIASAVTGDDLIPTPEEPRVPGMGYKGEAAMPWESIAGGAASLLTLLAPKIPDAELMAGTPGIKAPKLPRVNLAEQEDAAASDFSKTIDALERMGNAGSGYFYDLLKQKASTDQKISAQEVEANKALAAQEAGIGVHSARVNKASADMVQAHNQAAKNRREEFFQEQTRADIDAIRQGIQTSLKDSLEYKSEKEYTDAIDVYDTRGFNRTFKDYQKKRDRADKRGDTTSPFFGMTDEELRKATASEIQARTGFDSRKHTADLETIMAELAKLGEIKPQSGGRKKKYTRKINKIR